MNQQTPPDEVQTKAASMVSSVFTTYEDRMMSRKEELLDIFEEYSTFKESVNSNWSTSFKVNKAHQIIENITSSIVAKAPRWIVSTKNVKSFKDTPEITRLKEAMLTEQGGAIADVDNMVMAQKEESVQDHAEAIQDYLTHLFDKKGYMDRIELWAKNGIADGKGYEQIVWKIEKSIIPKKVAVTDPKTGKEIKDKEGELQYVESSEMVTTGQYPTIETISWADAYYDARYINLDDRPAFMRVKSGVRLGDLLRYKKKYMNLDKLKEMALAGSVNMNREDFKQRMQQITGIQDSSTLAKVDENSLTLIYYWGYFSHTGEAEDEKLYEIVVAEKSVVIKMQEIMYLPIEEWKCFPNTKDGGATGYVEPIVGLQEEMNFKKNSASEYINKSLQRQRIWSPNSGIDPETINDVIIPTDKDGQTALNNFPEVPFSQVGQDYFAEGNDFERQMQSATFTVDTANPRNREGLTNTATGAKIKFFESNKVTNAVRERFERAMERLAYKLIQCAFDNMEDNIIFKKTKSEGYWHMNKEVMRDALNKYEIKIETNSSSHTDIQDRRNEAIAWFNMLAALDGRLAESGSPKRVDFVPVTEEISATFEKKNPNRFLKNMQLEQSIPGQAPPTPMVKPGQPAVTEPERMTKSVVGNI